MSPETSQKALAQIDSCIADIDKAIAECESRLQAASAGKPAAAPPPPPKKRKLRELPKPGPLTYTVKQDDSLTVIALATLGKASRWREIFDLNQAVIGGNPDHIVAGQKLALPVGAKLPGDTGPAAKK